MRFSIAVLLVLALVGWVHAAAPATRALPEPAATPGVGWYVTENFYYGKPGTADEVYQTRLEATAAIAALGLPAGIVMRGPGGDGPDAIWQSAPYHDLDDMKATQAKLHVDPRFQAAYR